MNIIDGKKIAEKIKNNLAKEIYDLIQVGNRRPSLAIVLVGDRSDSKLYVSLKEKSAKEVGIDTSLYLLNENDSEDVFMDTINFLNQDDNVDGILIQLPLPKKFNTNKILQNINPEKDVDGFCTGRSSEILSPVLMAIRESLTNVKKDFKNTKAFLFYNSEIFRDETKVFLKKNDILLDSVSSDDFDQKRKEKRSLELLQTKTREYDILISAVGSPRFIKKEFLSDGMTIIDVGITKEGEKVFGDVDFEDVKKMDLNITPVPGGVGPMTVACVLKNTLIAYKLRQNK
ncbi:bifunctional methylenetetrahydrofolate dehydrogenase/methenyltetrahydrofolate cyclohydrolase [Candidatus Falkowbacteria bacterium HGW-Falkowbacteria-1]|jgi:methylenetetrahydrofolate dehydrogenase (NADP+)/methenyltetrahydrofolate cyclohydrolase|uniref:Bifunctional protein FolD n=1 Tax=Candidatus Falkowbacteria bacterium HGW-Falkowbacteria-1 TaxID=2013768 RepID=A0A2N2E8E8_9BACT|nr:MAG: bifunctional methylenetetrahydrofolate dehydrogenase/methenyltetrahydrofolate cyclohydrolase [Candidatus Falkowbacteria bacterium HGW-Falkowbacteria-1]